MITLLCGARISKEVRVDKHFEREQQFRVLVLIGGRLLILELHKLAQLLSLPDVVKVDVQEQAEGALPPELRNHTWLDRQCFV